VTSFPRGVLTTCFTRYANAFSLLLYECFLWYGEIHPYGPCKGVHDMPPPPSRVLVTTKLKNRCLAFPTYHHSHARRSPRAVCSLPCTSGTTTAGNDMGCWMWSSDLAASLNQFSKRRITYATTEGHRRRQHAR